MCPLEMQALSCQADLLAQRPAVPCGLTTLTQGGGLHLPSKGSGETAVGALKLRRDKRELVEAAEPLGLEPGAELPLPAFRLSLGPGCWLPPTCVASAQKGTFSPEVHPERSGPGGQAPSRTCTAAPPVSLSPQAGCPE